MPEPLLTPEHFANPRQHIRAIAPRVISLALGLVIVQVLFAMSYLGAFGKSVSSDAPVIVVGTTEGNAGYIANKLNDLDGQPVIAEISENEADAVARVKRDEAVAVYVFHPSKTGKLKDDLYYASAQGAARKQIALTVGENIARQGKRELVKHDVVPAKAADTRATAPFYLVLAWLIGGYVLAAALASLVSPRAASRQGVLARLALFAGYAVISGLAGAWVGQSFYDALGGSYWDTAGTGMLVVFTVGVFTYGLTSLLGTAGVGIAILLFVVLGNPSAGGAFNYDVLPQPWRAVGPYLPNGAGVDIVRAVSYFPEADLTRPFWVLTAWLIAGLWILFMVGNNTYRFGRSLYGTAAVTVPDEHGFGSKHYEPSTEPTTAQRADQIADDPATPAGAPTVSSDEPDQKI